MKILILNGSPHLDGATSDMVNAFAEGAREAGHEVVSVNVAHKNIKGCMACEYCRNREKGVCVQKDDMQAIYPEILSADMVVFASPIYYFTMTAQMEAAIQRVYCIGKPLKAKKAALLLSSGSDGVYDAAIAQFKGYMGYAGIKAAGIITAYGDENKSEAKLGEIREFAKGL